MIYFKKEYYNYIISKGVGNNDKVASSPDSYMSYLESVSELTANAISPNILNSYSDVDNIAASLYGKRAKATIDNYKTAMRHYVDMIKGMQMQTSTNNEKEESKDNDPRDIFINWILQDRHKILENTSYYKESIYMVMGEYKRESHILLHSFETNILYKLTGASYHKLPELKLSCFEALVNCYGFDSTLAEWCIETWCVALDLPCIANESNLVDRFVDNIIRRGVVIESVAFNKINELYKTDPKNARLLFKIGKMLWAHSMTTCLDIAINAFAMASSFGHITSNTIVRTYNSVEVKYTDELDKYSRGNAGVLLDVMRQFIKPMMNQAIVNRIIFDDLMPVVFAFKNGKYEMKGINGKPSIDYLKSMYSKYCYDGLFAICDANAMSSDKNNHSEQLCAIIMHNHLIELWCLRYSYTSDDDFNYSGEPEKWEIIGFNDKKLFI